MTHRILMTHPDYEAAKSVCRRSDLFSVPDAAHAQTDITYRSGRREGEVTLVSEVEQNRQLDSTSLALFLALCDLVHPVGWCPRDRWAVRPSDHGVAGSVEAGASADGGRSVGKQLRSDRGPYTSACKRSAVSFYG